MSLHFSLDSRQTTDPTENTPDHNARTAPNSLRPLALSLTVLGGVTRLVPHWWNFTAVGGASLFAGARLQGWKAFLVPLAIMLVTDPILGALMGFPPFTPVTLFVYGSFMLNVLIGRLLRKTESPLRIAGASLLASCQFFLVTNLGVWLGSSYFPPTFEGLLLCFGAAIPFFGWTVLGDLFYSGVLFGGHSFLARRVSMAELAEVKN